MDEDTIEESLQDNDITAIGMYNIDQKQFLKHRVSMKR